ncbi:GNAT family N-acetyltransferase [Fictibacillus nanhaiensis]|uniref:GNAT family N-acetyltransferase n=1 Tax=Fictibacillus nanhaiensis TaxID=742169 RepID=UPI002E22B5A3|nr:GNAT family N-acetyltransferase [Fictibacillus nanhaiensis]
MLVIKQFSELSFNEAVSLWNESWKHYFSDMTMDLNRFILKIAGEGISLEKSVVAVYDGKLAGFVLNSFRTINGKRYVWNGGTAIAPPFRGMGVGKKLISSCLNIYEEEKVEIARLEAIKENDAAIKLYESMGYVTFEELTYLQHEGVITTWNDESSEIKVKEVPMHHLQRLSYFKTTTAWQTQFQSLKDFICVIGEKDDIALGYAVYKKVYKEAGELSAILLYQCVTDEKNDLQEDTVRELVKTVFLPAEGSVKRMTINIPKKEDHLNQLLLKTGFSTYVEQVHMEREIIQTNESRTVKTFSEID